MAIRINFDSSHNVQTPTFVLANRNGNKIGTIPATNLVFKDTMNSTTELTFKVNKEDNGVKYLYWKQLKDFKLAWCREWDIWFELQVDLEESTESIKSVIAKSLGEAELSQINLYGIEINTDSDIQDFAELHPQEDYVPTVLYNELQPQYSLLHRILNKAPHYTIGYVDSSLQHIQRTFSFDGTNILDALYEIAEELDAIIDIDSGTDENGKIKRTINIYDLEDYCYECGKRGNFADKCSFCESDNIRYGYGEDTTIFVSTDNLADDINYSTDADSVKNCFKLEAGDDLMTATLVNCNPNGSGYIWYISDELKEDMSQELVDKLDEYDTQYKYFQKEYVINIPTEYITAYNNLVDKYLPFFAEDDESKPRKITTPIVGYSALMQLYYDTIDFYLFLNDKLMPGYGSGTGLVDTTAEEQCAKLTPLNLSPVAVSNIKNATGSTVKSAVVGMAKVLVDNRYKVQVNDGYTYVTNTHAFVGSFTVTNYSDEEDTFRTNNITIYANGDYETFVKQKIDKTLNSDVKDITDVVNLFKLDSTNFTNELKKYNLTSLNSFYDACEACINVMIEQGVSDGQTWGETYERLYQPYLDKLDIVNDEIDIREQEISKIVGEYITDDNGVKTLVTAGIQNKIDEENAHIQDELLFEKFIGEELWLEFATYRRDDTYSNSNYISDGLNSSQLFQNALEFIETAKKDIYKSATLQHSISSSLKNLLVMEEFAPIIDYFKIGNWIRIKVDDEIYKLRLLDYQIDFENLNNISITFSDVKKITDGYSDLESIIKSASSMATSYDTVSRQAGSGQRSNELLQTWFDDGLSLTNMRIVGNVDNQDQTWDSHGMLFRKYNPELDDYENTQMKIINSTIALTTDNWQTTKTAIGKFIYRDMANNGEYKEGYGINGEVLVGKLILGETLAIYNSSNSEMNSLTFDNNGLIVTGNHSKIQINANPSATESVFTIFKDDTKVLYLDKDGNATFTGTVYASNGEFTGTVHAASGEFTGEVNATSGKIGNWTIATNGFYDISGGSGKGVGINHYASNKYAFWAGTTTLSGADAPFRVGFDGKVYASNAEIHGSVYAGSGSIGNWTIATNGLYDNSGGAKKYIGINHYSTDKYAFYAGGSNTNGSDAKFRVGFDGKIYAQDLYCDGVTRSMYIQNGRLYTQNAKDEWIGELSIDTSSNNLVQAFNKKYAYYITGYTQSGSDLINGRSLVKFSFPRTEPASAGDMQLYGTFSCNYDFYVGGQKVTSDKKVKNHIEYLADNDDLEKFVLGLQPAMYTMTNGTSQRHHLGFYAQDVSNLAQSTIGDCALYQALLIDENSAEGDAHEWEFDPSVSDDKLKWYLNYNELIAPIVSILQKSMKRISQLENEIKALRG